MTEVKKSFDERVEERVVEELTTVDMDQMYDDMLDEMSGDCYTCKACGGGARVMKEVDPIAYNCGYSDYTDSMSDQYEEINGEYYNKEEVDAIRSEIEDEVEEQAGNEKEEGGE